MANNAVRSEAMEEGALQEEVELIIWSGGGLRRAKLAVFALIAK